MYSKFHDNSGTHVPIAVAVGVGQQPYINNEHDVAITVGQPIKPTNSSFINKTLFYILIQLLFTSLISTISYIYRKDIINIITHNPVVIIIPLIVFVISSIALACCSRDSKKCLYSMFGLFTISSACVVSISILPYSPLIVLQAVTGTTVAVSSINMYAFWCSQNNVDFISWSKALAFASLSIIPILILQIFLPSNSPFQVIVSIFIMLLFSVYLIYDLNQLYNGNNEFIFEEPILAAVNIYLDIINIFLYMLQILSVCGNNN